MHRKSFGDWTRWGDPTALIAGFITGRVGGLGPSRAKALLRNCTIIFASTLTNFISLVTCYTMKNLDTTY